MQWKCPTCGDASNLKVSITAFAILTQAENGENFETEVVGDHEFDGQSTMVCLSCDHHGPAHSFQYEPTPKS